MWVGHVEGRGPNSCGCACDQLASSVSFPLVPSLQCKRCARNFRQPSPPPLPPTHTHSNRHHPTTPLLAPTGTPPQPPSPRSNQDLEEVVRELMHPDKRLAKDVRGWGAGGGGKERRLGFAAQARQVLGSRRQRLRLPFGNRVALPRCCSAGLSPSPIHPASPPSPRGPGRRLPTLLPSTHPARARADRGARGRDPAAAVLPRGHPGGRVPAREGVAPTPPQPLLHPPPGRTL
jgi:hypothetical protein